MPEPQPQPFLYFATAGAAWVLGRRALVDLPTAALFAATLLLLQYARRLPEPAVIALAGVAGVVLRGRAG